MWRIQERLRVCERERASQGEKGIERSRKTRSEKEAYLPLKLIEESWRGRV